MVLPRPPAEAKTALIKKEERSSLIGLVSEEAESAISASSSLLGRKAPVAEILFRYGVNLRPSPSFFKTGTGLSYLGCVSCPEEGKFCGKFPGP